MQTEPVRILTPEQRAVLSRIAGLIEYWRFTPEEIAAAKPTRPPGVRPSVKYRHPQTGQTWDGQGPHPDWLRHALLKEGYRVSELSPG